MENIVRFIVIFIIVMAALTVIPRVAEFIIEKIATFVIIYRGGRLIQGYEKDFNSNNNRITSKCAREFYKFSIVCRDVCSNYIVNHIMKKIFEQIEQDKGSPNHYLTMPAEKDFNNLLRMYVEICQFSAMYDPITFDEIHNDENEINSKPGSYKFALALAKRYNSIEFIDAIMMHFTSVIIAYQKYIRDKYDINDVKHNKLISVFDIVDKTFSQEFDSNIIPDAKTDFLKKIDEQVQAITLDQRYLDVFDVVYYDYIEGV